MKLNEIQDTEQLDEIKIRHALAGAALAASLSTVSVHQHDVQKAKTEISAAQAKIDKAESEAKTAKTAAEKAKAEAEIESALISKLTDIVLDKYKIAPANAKHIVELVNKYADPVFPKAEDLLAIIGIESSFNPSAKSGLKHDKAVGLTQIRPKIWGIHAKNLRGHLDKQVELASDILNKYYQKLGSKDKAIHAYNVGLTNVRHGKGLNPAYVTKWKAELKRYS
jgi:soluble lytic murein transglycosylase-like protein